MHSATKTPFGMFYSSPHCTLEQISENTETSLKSQARGETNQTWKYNSMYFCITDFPTLRQKVITNFLLYYSINTSFALNTHNLMFNSVQFA